MHISEFGILILKKSVIFHSFCMVSYYGAIKNLFRFFFWSGLDFDGPSLASGNGFRLRKEVGFFLMFLIRIFCVLENNCCHICRTDFIIQP